jgi:hypothetical protein
LEQLEPVTRLEQATRRATGDTRLNQTMHTKQATRRATDFMHVDTLIHDDRLFHDDSYTQYRVTFSEAGLGHSERFAETTMTKSHSIRLLKNTLAVFFKFALLRAKRFVAHETTACVAVSAWLPSTGTALPASGTARRVNQRSVIHRPSGPRRGVIMVVVLGMLALFALVAITFAIIARQHKTGASMASVEERYGDSPKKLTDEALMQVIRGSKDANTPLARWSLLEDLYGESVAGTVTSSPGAFDPGGQILMFSITTDPRYAGLLKDVSNTAFKVGDGYFNGRVLTMLSGPAKGQSTRIVGFDASTGILQVVGFSATGALVDLPRAGDRFLINGRPFSGHGFGYDKDTYPNTGLLDAKIGTYELALLPNHAAPDTQQVLAGVDGILGTYDDPIMQANENYDAADYQNIHLAWQISPGPGQLPVVVRPSFHDPALVNYWQQRALSESVAWNDPTNAAANNLKRKVFMRPLVEDHPRFAVVNPAFDPSSSFYAPNWTYNPASGAPQLPPWDVDNNGDGLMDSIWLHIGLPVQTAEDGRLYRPLVAYLILDMDGKLNLNVHGSTSLVGADPRAWDQLSAVFAHGPLPLPSTAPPGMSLADMNDNLRDLPVTVGSGYSVAEVNLSADLGGARDSDDGPVLFGGVAGVFLSGRDTALAMNPPLAAPEYYQVLHGRPADAAVPEPIMGRYGEAHLIGGAPPPRAGLTLQDDNRPVGIVDQVLGSLPPRIALRGNQLQFSPHSLYRTPGDPDGDGALALGLHGLPVYGPSAAASSVMSAMPQPGIYSPADASAFAATLGYGGGDGSISIHNSSLGMAYLSSPWALSGMPSNMGETALSDAVDEPWEMDVSARGRQRRATAEEALYPFGSVGVDPRATVEIDAPFGPDDMEWILRPFDRDSASLESRLAELAPLFANDVYRRSLATTESWSIPSPVMTPPPKMLRRLLNHASLAGQPELRERLLREPTLVDLLAARLLVGGVSVSNLPDQISGLLPPSLVAGQRFDLNRPFGNGIDDNNNGVVDEPREWADSSDGLEYLWRGTAIGGGNGVPMDLDRDGDLTNDPADPTDDPQPRYHYARYLYVLMMLLADVDHTDASSYRIPLANEAVADPLHYELTARRIAQWAINVVDFRDPDVIMSGFEVDLYPFDGWDVNGDLIDNDVTTQPRARAVVWGCERPELLLTETAAFHDLGTDDTDEDDGDGTLTTDPDPQDRDDDFDQIRLPQGSLIIELFNPWNASDPRDYPAELYSYGPGAGDFPPANPANVAAGRNQNRDPSVTPWGLGGLDLGRLAPGNGTNAREPVWRILICEAALTQSKHLEQNFDTASGEPYAPDLTNPAAPPVQVERMIWMVSRSQYASAQGGSGGDPNTVKNNFAVPVAANVPIYFNDLQDWATSPTDYQNKVEFSNSDQEFLLKPGHYAVLGPRVTTVIADDENLPPLGMLQMLKSNGNSYMNSLQGRFIKVVGEVAIPDGIAPPPVPPWAPDQIKMPLPIVLNAPHALSISEPVGGYTRTPTGTRQGPNPDDPTGATPANYNDAFNPPLDMPLDLSENAQLPRVRGTSLRHRTIFLQRLANPLQPHDRERNPYRTIDWMHVDLTIFNGPTDAVDPAMPGTLPSHFASRERAGKLRLGPLSADANLWHQQTADPPMADRTGPIQSFGYLNNSFTGGFLIPGQEPWTQADLSTLLGVAQGHPEVMSMLGDPRKPFPWMTWLDRPFANQMELLLVPSSSQARLMWEYTIRGIAANEDAYAPEPNLGPVAASPNRYSFGHLMNFFTSSKADLTLTEAHDRPNFHRVLEFLHVPSRFSGTETMFNPDVFAAIPGHAFMPPYNRIPSYREPGRINLNTIADAGHTFRGMLNRFPSGITGPLGVTEGPGNLAVYGKLVRSRRGYQETADATNPNPLLMNPAYPTFIANPFRSPASSYDVPLASLRMRPGGANPRENVESGLLRADPDNEDVPLFAFNSNFGHNDTNRNPYFRYQMYQKLGNVAGTQSNVYAIWITVGYFEVTRGPVDPAHPDGYYLGPELGTETGDIQRHRAFHIYDRSIPMGFERGEDHNVLDGLLMRSAID